jgi:RecA/RadA recombinase
MPVDPSQWDAYVAAIEKEYGKGTIRRGSADPNVEHISTGSHELDHICGGGVPMGRFSRFYGGYSSAKSLTCWNVVKSAHSYGQVNKKFPNGLEVIYYNLEKQFDRKYCEQLGVDVNRLRIVDADTIEDCGTMLHDLMDVAHLHIIDSCSSVPSTFELQKDLDERTMGMHPKQWGIVLRRALKKLDTKENAVIMVDQIRDVFGSGGQAPPGGRQMEHVSSLSLMFRRGKWLHHDANGILDPDAKPAESLGEATDPRGMEIQVRVEKSRVCRPLRSARLRLDLKTGTWDLTYELAKAGLYFDDIGEPAHESGRKPIITITGPGRYEIGGTKIHGKKKLRMALEGDRVLQDVIKDAMLRAA